MPLLVVSHALLGVACVALRGLPVAQRFAGLRFLAGVGALSSVVLFLARGVESSWGTMELGPARSGLVAVATFCAWVAVLASDERNEPRWDLGALVGAGGTAVAVIATTRWIVPCLLFWMVLSAVTLVAARERGPGAHVAAAVGLADACFVAGVLGHALTSETWSLPTRLDGVWLYLAIVAIVLRAGALPAVGMGAAFGRGEGALLPLAVASAFAVVPFVSGGDEVAVALPLLLLAAGAIAWSLAVETPRLSVIAVWPLATMLAIAWIEPAAVARAAATAAIVATMVSLWPLTSGRAQSERGLILAALPATIGFGAIAGGAAASFTRAVAEGAVLAAAPWHAVAALLPVVLAGGVALGATIGRRTELERFRPEAVLATWTLAAVALVTGLSPAARLGFSSGTDGGGRAVPLFVLALLVGLVAARFAPRSTIPLTPPRPAPAAGVVDLGGSIAAWVRWAGVGIFSIAAAAVLWLTYSGLSVGFL